ncbi:MAG TPA: D-alanyl-D-alanine carboxypeptidase family protein [Burkholderiales bacterium]|nr:D-alanyl-D-alanine carboxypeptidase family protein [Burkholderiales bacterium]
MLKGGAFVAAVLFASAALAVDSGPFPRIADAYLVKRDGKVLWAGDEDARRAPASLTKMMTALVILERGLLEEPVVVSRGASRERGSRIGLRAGDQVRTRDLLAATIMHSANDACHALADHVGPTFVSRMNQRAQSLGMKNTQFVDPCGWDRPGHYSTAADLARLAEVAMQHPEYQRLARLRDTVVRTVDGRKRFNVRNTNFLIGRYSGTVAGKTGTTGAAGYCLVALAERNGSRVTVVLLNSPRRWSVTPRLFDRAFAVAM